MDFAREDGYRLGEILPEKDAARLEPLDLERERVLEDGWGVGEEGSVPEVGAAAVEDVEVAALEVEAEGAGALVLAVDDDEVGGLEFGLDGGGQLAGAQDRFAAWGW
jgi:hypothetical protein